jgi:uroporphyrinogen decarboxylase
VRSDGTKRSDGALTPRERVAAVVERRMPPVLASTFKATEEVDRMMMGHFGVSEVEALVPALGVCYLHWPWRNVGPRGLRAVRTEDGVEYDVWGIGRREVSYGTGSYWEIVHSPLAAAETVADVERYDWPTVERLDFSGIAAECEAHADTALSIWHWSLFERAWEMRGFERFLVDMASNERLAGAVIGRIEEFNWQVIAKTLEATGGRVRLFGSSDDFGSQTSLLMSVEMWEHYFAPGYRRAHEFAHSRGLTTWLHSDGAIRPLIPKLIDAGLDVLDPLMPMIEQMSPYRIIPEFGRDLCFHGTIDVQHLLPFESERAVRAEIRRQMEALWSRGGLFMGPSHMIQPGTPLGNILAVYDELQRAAADLAG